MAAYTIDSMALELTVSLPPDYPLSSVEVECTKGLGFSATLLKKWLLQLVVFINAQVCKAEPIYSYCLLLRTAQLWTDS